jgi:hypothetical protein
MASHDTQTLQARELCDARRQGRKAFQMSQLQTVEFAEARNGIGQRVDFAVTGVVEAIPTDAQLLDVHELAQPLRHPTELRARQCENAYFMIPGSSRRLSGTSLRFT